MWRRGRRDPVRVSWCCLCCWWRCVVVGRGGSGGRKADFCFCFGGGSGGSTLVATGAATNAGFECCRADLSDFLGKSSITSASTFAICGIGFLRSEDGPRWPAVSPSLPFSVGRACGDTGLFRPGSILTLEIPAAAAISDSCSSLLTAPLTVCLDLSLSLGRRARSGPKDTFVSSVAVDRSGEFVLVGSSLANGSGDDDEEADADGDDSDDDSKSSSELGCEISILAFGFRPGFPRGLGPGFFPVRLPATFETRPAFGGRPTPRGLVIGAALNSILTVGSSTADNVDCVSETPN